jgi:hypothetical protein
LQTLRLLGYDVAMSLLDEMTPKQVWEWEWRALPTWAKAVTFLIGLPAFGVLTWSVFDDSVSGIIQAICFALFAAVALVQVYCLNRIIQKNGR